MLGEEQYPPSTRTHPALIPGGGGAPPLHEYIKKAVGTPTAFVYSSGLTFSPFTPTADAARHGGEVGQLQQRGGEGGDVGQRGSVEHLADAPLLISSGDHAGVLQQLPCPAGGVQFNGQGNQREDRSGGKSDHTQPGEVADLEDHPDQEQDPAGLGTDVDGRDERPAEPHGEVFLLVLLGVAQFVGGDRHGGDAGALGDALGKAEGVIPRVVMIRQPTGDAFEL